MGKGKWKDWDTHVHFFLIMMQIDFMVMDYGLLVRLPVVPAMEN